jgi:hypothetical protein
MKRIVETPDGGFEALLDEKITLFCAVYIYTGRLAGVNEDHLELSEPKIVFQTGNVKAGEWDEAEELPTPWRVMRQAIESWGAAKC